LRTYLGGDQVATLYCFFPDNNRQFALQMKLWREWFAHRGLCLTILRGSCERALEACRELGKALVNW